MPRFVLLYHECPPNYGRSSHWDFMLESGAVLRTWALEQLPYAWSDAHSRTKMRYPHCRMTSDGNAVAATQLGDHRRDYLALEGPLGGDRGSVIRVAAGIYRSAAESPDYWQLVLTGDDLRGALMLTRSSAVGGLWMLECGLPG